MEIYLELVMFETLPRRVYGTHWPEGFYRSKPEPARYRGIARVPDGCLAEFVIGDDAELDQLRDALKRWAPSHAA